MLYEVMPFFIFRCFCCYLSFYPFSTLSSYQQQSYSPFLLRYIKNAISNNEAFLISCIHLFHSFLFFIFYFYFYGRLVSIIGSYEWVGETLVAFPLVLRFHFIIRGFIPSGCIMGILFFYFFFISILYSFICLTISLLYFMHFQFCSGIQLLVCWINLASGRHSLRYYQIVG